MKSSSCWLEGRDGEAVEQREPEEQQAQHDRQHCQMSGVAPPVLQCLGLLFPAGQQRQEQQGGQVADEDDRVLQPRGDVKGGMSKGGCQRGGVEGHMSRSDLCDLVGRQFVPSDNSSQIPKSDNSSQASIRPILKRRQFVPFVKSDNSSQIV